MTNYHLKTFRDVEKLVEFCRNFNSEVDVIHQRYTIDGKSMLGVMSLVGNVVCLEIISDDEKEINRFNVGINRMMEEADVY